MRSAFALSLALTLLASAAAGQDTPGSTVTNSIGMEFVRIPAGTLVVGRFQVVCPTAGPGTSWTPTEVARCEELAKRDERPGFEVRIQRPFLLGKYEVTQGQWKRVMGSNPSVFQGSRVTDDADAHPVDNVTWAQAQEFVRRLNELDRTAHYRLPTEFEWEYAAHGGDPDEPTWAAARAQAVASGTTTARVGTKVPNAYGLYDMFGNVWEWVEDYYNEKLFPDPTPPRVGTVHVLKGASFIGDVKNYTPATHAAGPASGWDVGFRVVREVRFR